MIDASQAGTPGWWLRRLVERLGRQKERYDILESYYEGTAGVPVLAVRSVRESYTRLMQMSGTNFGELVVEAVRERMNVNGFRTGADGDDLGDAEAWRIWQANHLDADSALVHRASLAMSDAYVMVGGVDSDIEAPVITVEDPREVITQQDPIRRRKTIAALKVFYDEVLGVDRAFLFLPGQVWKALRTRRDADQLASATGEHSLAYDMDGWDWQDNTPERVPARAVPVVRFPNRAKMSGAALGEFEPHIQILDRINFSILSRLEIATLQAFRQRAIKGVPTHTQDADGNAVEIDYTNIFAADPGAMWQIPLTAEIWESGQVDLGPIRDAIRHDVQDLAAVTRTPLFYLTPDANNGSAEGASLAREGLVFKTADRLVQAGEPWEQVMSLAFTFAGDEDRANRRDMEIIWASPERFSLAERYDAASKAAPVGVPWRTIMQDILQFSPQQVDRMEAERAAEALLAPEPPQVTDGAVAENATVGADQTVPAEPVPPR